MGAPMTELLFLFLLGIASWSRCVTANTFTADSCSADVVDGNNEVESIKCDTNDNKFNLYVRSKTDYQGAVQFQMDLMKDDEVVNNVAKSLPNPTKELQDLCSSVESPDSDDSYSMCQGEYTATECDIESMAKDLDPGKYVALIRLSTENGDFGKFEIKFETKSD